MTEPDVTLTDYGLAIEGAALAWMVARGGPYRPSSARLLRWTIRFFVSLAVAAAAGGTVHGFFLDPGSRGAAILWPATMLTIGVTAVSAWMMGGALFLSEASTRRLAMAAAAVFAAYAAVVLFVSQAFWIAVAHYLPAAAFLLLAFLVRHTRGGAGSAAKTGAIGLALTFVASGIQIAGVSVHPRYFNHNALYHLVQAVAVFLVYKGIRGLLERGPADAGKQSHAEQT